MAAQTADPATPRDKPAPPAAAAPAAAATAGEQNKDEQPPRPADAAAAAGAKDGDKDAPADAEEDEADVGPAGTGSVVDMDVFGQLLEIDDDESHEFSKTLAFDYIAQADVTFNEIEEALAAKDLDALSRKGHFLKGSSAALGLQRVQHSCEAMQHFGKRRDARGEGPEVAEDEALNRCRVLLVRLKKEQAEAKEWLEAFYKDSASA